MRATYAEAIREAFEYLLDSHREVFVVGQGLWSPWYVGSSMNDLEKRYGTARVIDTPVSELATTGAALGASLCGYRPVVVHPRVDFMLLAIDQLVTQAAKWRSMFGGDVSAPVTIRAIVNRGGQQGAQHSQSLQSWFAHVPGLRVVMPATPQDARDLLIASVLCDDPVLYIDDRWLYEEQADLPPVGDLALAGQGPRIIRAGKDVTLVGCGYATRVCIEAADTLARDGISAEVIDLRVLNPFAPDLIIESAARTNRLVAVDGDWRTCGMSSEILASVAERRDAGAPALRTGRVTHPDAPAPTSAPLESAFYFSAGDVVSLTRRLCM
ncbi:MAG: alpha-ketoacid dehydrogenase subunit beta [Gemmatimonadetes bacterium]|nr:alpha-ketoacid dehydrogenase subunit beta [Gemmatimonadota bacterium]